MIRVGTCSWTDPTLFNYGRFYPPEAKTAEAPRFYAKHFTRWKLIVHIIIRGRNSPGERTPAGFIFNIKAYRALLCMSKAAHCWRRMFAAR